MQNANGEVDKPRSRRHITQSICSPLNLNGAGDVVTTCQPSTPIDEAGRGKGYRWAHISLTNPCEHQSARTVVGPMVSGLPRGKRCCRRLGPTCSWRNFPRRPCGCMETTKKFKVRADECFRPLSSRHLCPHFAPFHFLSIYIFSFPFSNIQDR